MTTSRSIISLIAVMMGLGGPDFDDAHAQSQTDTLEDIIIRTPGIRPAGSTQLGGIGLSVRGRNALDENGGTGVIIDGIPMANAAILARIIPDLDSIEIRKGPQGRDASAGAFIVTTRAPGDNLAATALTSVGNDNTYTVQGTLAGPVTRDKIYFDLMVDTRITDGFFKNTLLNATTVDDATTYNLGGRLLFNFAAASTLDLKGHWGHTQAGDSAFDGVFALPVFAQFLKRPLFNENINAHAFAFQNNIRPVHRQRAADISTRWDENLGWGLLTAWALFNDVHNDLAMDGAGGIFGTFNGDRYCQESVAAQFAAGKTLPQPQSLGATPEGSLFGVGGSTGCDGTHYQVRNQSELSTEVRLTSLHDVPLRWTVGASFRHLTRRAGVNVGVDTGRGVVRQLFVPASGANPTEQLFEDSYRTDAASAFADVAYDIFDELAVTAAVRHEGELRRVHNRVPTGALTRYVVEASGAPFTGGAPLNPALDAAFSAAGTIPDQRATSGQTAPKVALTWTSMDDLTLFADWSIGLKSGGFNSLGTAAAVDLFINNPLGAGLSIDDRFAEERASAIEGGFRAQLLDRRITLNGRGYYTRVKNMQFAELLAGPFGLLRAVNTIDRVRVVGGEIDASAEVMEGMTIFAGGNVQSSKILTMTSRPDAVGNTAPFAPDYTVNGGAQFSIPITPAFRFVSRADFSLTGPTAFHVIQCQNRPTVFGVSGNTCGAVRNSFTSVDMRVGIQTAMWSASAFVKNITNDRHVGEAIVVPELGLSFLLPGDLRRFGADVTYKF